MYRSSPVRSTLNTNVITGLRMCQVCTEAVHCVSLWTRTLSQVGACVKYVPKQSMSKKSKKPVQKPKHRLPKKGTKPGKGCVSRSASPGLREYKYFWLNHEILWDDIFIFLLLIFLKHPTCRPPRARQTLQTALALSPPVGRGWQIILHSKKM